MLAGYQRALRDVCFDREPPRASLEALGDDPAVWRTYRRMVRARLRETIDHGFSRLRALAGDEAFSRVADRFFAESPPRSQYLRDVPGEMLAFLERAPDALAGLGTFALDLARFEWAELEVAYAPDPPPEAEIAPLAMDRPALLAPAHRLLALDHPVQRLDPEASVASVGPERTFLCVYRDPSSFDVRALELTEVTFELLREAYSSTMPLAESVRAAAARVGAAIDAAFVDALSTVLSDFVERGLLLGSRAS